ncbi:MAG: hemerythrin domain-containing protein [Planctomycetota bacterium]
MSQSDGSGRNLAVNAAFLKDIKDDNRRLKELLDDIQGITNHAQVAANHWQQFVDRLQELCDQLAFHFSLEEAYGYFDEAVEVQPQQSVLANRLRDEHPKLFAEIRDLADRVGDMDPTNEEKVTAALDHYATFYRRFSIHEESEVKMILASLDDDIGVGD